MELLGLKMPKDLVSRYEYAKSKEGLRDSEEMYDSGILDNDQILTQSESPKRSNYYKYKNPEDAKEAYESLQAENEMRIGMKKGGSVSSASKRADGCAVKGKTKGRMI